MSLIKDCIDALASVQVFSVLENGFFHVPLAEDSRKYTFVTHDGQYEFVKTPFGPCKSPTSFFVDEIFKDLSRRGIVFTYMDDLIVPGKDWSRSVG